MSVAHLADIEQLMKQVVAYHPEADTSLLLRAYEYSVKAHEGQMRQTGEPYVQHPLAVAGILTFLKLDVPAIAAGLLHDTLEDTVATEEELKKEFGADVAQLVEGVTKIGQIPFKSYEEKQAENFRKMVLSMADDIRVVFIKLADRLHNMQTLEGLSDEKRKKISQETMEIYAPLANRLGISWIKQELEDLCFQYLQPEACALLKLRLAKRDDERQAYIQTLIQMAQEALTEAGLPGQIDGRPKHLFSIYQKMERRSVSFDEIYDLTAIRIVTDSKMNCYAVLGLIHSIWPPVPGRVKDYVATPRSNLYQSLHTTVVGPQGEYVEFQIRTAEMHRINEYGVAAHWLYKEPMKARGGDGEVFSWLRQFVEWHKDLSDNRQFMDSVKLDLFHDVVFVFTPKGEVREVPVGSTPLDLAYAIHTEIGDHCVGAKVNGKLVPLRYQLHSGDMVEILTSPAQVPHRGWLKFVRTSKAKTKIKHWFKVAEQKRALELGRRLLEQEFQRKHLSAEQSLKSERLVVMAKVKDCETVDELIRMVGFGRIAPDQIVSHFKEESEQLPSIAIKGEVSVPHLNSPGPLNDRPVKFSGTNDVLMQLSKCCKPVPGEPIRGYITRGRGLTIHAVDCPNFQSLEWEHNRLVEVEWDVDVEGSHSVDVSVLTLDRPGVLAKVSSGISQCKANITKAEISTREDQKAVLDFVIEVKNTSHLELILQEIQRVEGILTAKRVRGWS
ncbi:MAG: bifunctional (p)ppGpp synthetase/guanosine-3',5'-bis(diphosphate) 3'-pyrophosphohydrolase [Nitrospirota bacterium]|nr:MAG: bifunctional (p)ppGpp synthetase/guanosine-3',5'-bis(diphosphate) 3'-pyrophosphohydrolase [Nitrospirota bacterium]